MGQMRSPIPLCRSKLLQDVTIELGRRSLKSMRYRNPTLKFEVSDEEVEGNPMERLDIEARNPMGRMIKVTIWADGVAWVYTIVDRSEIPSKHVFETHADLAGRPPEQIAELIRGTLADLGSVQKIWQQRAIP
jgi:hypothetical protein